MENGNSLPMAQAPTFSVMFAANFGFLPARTDKSFRPPFEGAHFTSGLCVYFRATPLLKVVILSGHVTHGAGVVPHTHPHPDGRTSELRPAPWRYLWHSDGCLQLACNLFITVLRNLSM